MTDAVIFSIIPGSGGAIGKITLNRPQNLHALNLEMCNAIHHQLEEWAQLSSIKAVIITGSGERAFCAGGDLRAIYNAITSGKPTEAINFFQKEYALNQAIFEFPKPYFAFLDGITMGGGVGLSIHGSYQIATERLVWAMPETRIGFFSDVGAGYHLVKLPYHIGYYLALTGERISAEVAYQLGLVQAIVPSERLLELENTLIDTNFTNRHAAVVKEIIADFHCAKGQPDNQLSEHFSAIQTYFSSSAIDTILRDLQATPDPWCQATAKTLMAQSPLSLKLTLEHLHRCRTLDFAQVIAEDTQLAKKFVNNHDLVEGIRAAIVDKDHCPVWSPATLAEVTPALLKTYFQG